MIKSVHLVNFFSFSDCNIDLESDLNVLVGINGSGKSNFLKVFQLLRAGVEKKFRELVIQWGGHKALMTKLDKTENEYDRILIRITLSANVLASFGYNNDKDATYSIAITGTNDIDFLSIYEQVILSDGKLIFSTPYEGVSYYNFKDMKDEVVEDYKGTMGELDIFQMISQTKMPEVRAIARALRELDIYRAFNTSENSPMRGAIRATGVDKLLPSGDNIFQVLNTTGLKSTAAYDAIEVGLHDVNAHFQRFRMNVYGQGSIEFYLQEKGLGTPVHVAQVSDGTLCYLCLLVALHQSDRGNIILFDEPERNLHPDMLFELAKQLEKASEKSQIILTTHAPGLLNQFPLRAVRVFEKDENNQTQVKKFTEEDFAGWYDEFAPGQMWRNGDLGGNRY